METCTFFDVPFGTTFQVVDPRAAMPVYFGTFRRVRSADIAYGRGHITINAVRVDPLGGEWDNVYIHSNWAVKRL